MQSSFKIGQTIHNLHPSGFYFHSETPVPVADAIVLAHRCQTRVRLFYGDIITGESWGDEFDILGTIGRSMGPCKSPLIIRNARSMGGGSILTNCIVAMFHTGTGHALYRHPTFNPGAWDVIPSDMPGYSECVTHNGALHARFKKPGQAGRYCAFMRGTRFAK